MLVEETDIEKLRFDQPYNTQIKKLTVAKKLPKTAQIRDTFQTPNYAVDLLVPFIPKDISEIWECASGMGKIADRLEYHGYEVDRSDIRPYDNTEIWNFVLDWSDDKYFSLTKGYAIITNPPYSLKDQFIERAFEYGVPFAFLINADYSGKQIQYIKWGCEKIIPNRRIDFITPTGRNGKTSSSQFHSMWLTHGFNLGRTETFVELTNEQKKENI